MRILLVEDDRETAEHIKRGLEECGYGVDHAADGANGLDMASAGDYNVVIVDRMLPGLEGLELIRKLREGEDLTPVLILSALGDVDDRVKGLRAGGDDYLTKPFAFAELLARVEALCRRKDQDTTITELEIDDLYLNRLTREVRRGGKKINLQPREYRLLEYLMRNSGQVVTRTMLLENVWDYHFDPQTNIIDVHVSRLRGKIDKGFERPLLHTVRGAGYMLKA
ncbi:MAG: DNA-binding response regulator [Proteobacteria bacterium]|nr:MAG: DNA-binding response regulator [Pseudomonadota bacterium]